jgi:hypothetical protein
VFRLPRTPVRLIVRPPVAAALPPVPIVAEDWLGVVDSAPSPSEDAEVPPAAALPPVPTTPLALSGAAEAAPVPTVEAAAPGTAALPPAAPAPLFCASPLAAEPATSIAVSAAKANRLIVIVNLLCVASFLTIETTKQVGCFVVDTKSNPKAMDFIGNRTKR